jgi:hypothetical protein
MTIINGNFETGTFTNWRTIGDNKIDTSQGTFQALLSTGASASGGAVEQSDLEEFLDLPSGLLDNLGNGDVTEGSAIKQTFTANAGDVLTFDWNFLTNEGTPSFFNDFAFFGISPFSLELADTNSSDFFSTSGGNFNEQTGLKTISIGIAQTGTYTLSFGVVDVGDAIVDSALIVDNIQVLSFGGGGIGSKPSILASNTDVLLGAKGFLTESPLSSLASTDVGQLFSRSPELA